MHFGYEIFMHKIYNNREKKFDIDIDNIDKILNVFSPTFNLLCA